MTTLWSDQLLYGWTPPSENADGTPLTDLAGYNLYGCAGTGCTNWTLIASVDTAPDACGANCYDHTGLPTATHRRLMMRARDTTGTERMAAREAVARPVVPVCGHVSLFPRLENHTRDS